MKAGLARGVAAGTLAVGLVGWWAGPAQAHTSLVSATPGLNATVAPPGRIVLTYADPVRLTQVILTDPSGARHEDGKSLAVDNTVTEKVAGTLKNGVYTVAWRVVAPDGHPVEGTYTFTVVGSSAGTLSKDAPAAKNKSGDSSSTALWVGIGVVLVLGVGAGVFFVRRGLSVDGADDTDDTDGTGTGGRDTR